MMWRRLQWSSARVRPQISVTRQNAAHCSLWTRLKSCLNASKELLNLQEPEGVPASHEYLPVEDDQHQTMLSCMCSQRTSLPIVFTCLGTLINSLSVIMKKIRPSWVLLALLLSVFYSPLQCTLTLVSLAYSARSVFVTAVMSMMRGRVYDLDSTLNWLSRCFAT